MGIHITQLQTEIAGCMSPAFPVACLLCYFLGAFGPQHQEGETAGRMQVAGRGWGRTPGAALGGGARQDGAVSVDDSPVTEDTEGREGLKWPLTPWSAKDFVSQKTQFSIFFFHKYLKLCGPFGLC